MTHLDGNAIAGRLADLFGEDMTSSRARCASCGFTAELAVARLYVSPMGWVLRCAGCHAVLAVVVDGDGRTWISMRGISGVELSAD